MKYLVLLVPLQLLFSNIGIADIFHVPEEYETIQSAIDNALDGDSVVVNSGTYTENIFFSYQSLTLGSRFLIDLDTTHIANTLIQPVENSFQSIIRTWLSLEDTLKLSGITLTGARLHANVRDSLQAGGGLYVYGGNLDIDNCVFADNVAFQGGGFLSREAQVVVTNSVFTENLMSASGGGFIMHYDLRDRYPVYLEINNNYFARNSVVDTIYINNTGGGFAAGANVFYGNITDNMFVENYAGSAGSAAFVGCSFTQPEVELEISRNKFFHNEVMFSASIAVGGIGNLTFTHNELVGNRSYQVDAGGFYCASNTHTEIAYNRFIGNSGIFGGAIIMKRSGIIHDNIFVSNSGRTQSAIFLTSNRGDAGEEVIIERNIFTGHHYNEEDTLQRPDYYVAAVSVRPEGNILHLHENDFIDNQKYAAGLGEVWYVGVINAENNYWGHPSGPYHPDENPAGLGDTVRTNISILPFSNTPFTAPHSISLYLPEDERHSQRHDEFFMWSRAVDVTTLEPIQYYVQLSADDLFNDPIEHPAREDTSLVVNDLDFEQLYYWRIRAEDSFGLSGYSETRCLFLTSTPENVQGEIPTSWALDTAHPNPFNDSVTVQLAAPIAGNVTLQVYDINGRIVHELYNGTVQAGWTPFVWKTEGASGLYLIRATNGSWSQEVSVFQIK